MSTSRLSYAISLDGLFPRCFSDLHERYGTPHKNLIAQGVFALGLSLLGGLNQLILFSTFNLAFVYLVTCAAVLALRERGRIRTGRTVIEKMTGPTLPVAGILLSALLIFESGVTTVIFRAHNNCNRIRRDKFVGTAKRGIRHITNEYALKKSL